MSRKRADELEQEADELEIIKATTMYKMVENIDSGKRKLLFLTNQQADIIAGDSENCSRMLQTILDASPTRRDPSLLINLVKSFGGRASVEMQTPSFFANGRVDGMLAGVLHGCPPHLSREEEEAAIAKVDDFMADVLIPLAAQTNAIILCDASSKECSLSASFLRMCTVVGSQWGGKPPFTVISCTNQIMLLYQNHEPKAEWRRVRAQSKTWTDRDPLCRKVFGDDVLDTPREDAVSSDDLSVISPCTLIVDTITDGERDAAPYDRLISALVRTATAIVPSLVIKTGMNIKAEIGESGSSSLGAVVSQLNSGAPVLFLDLRARKPLDIEQQATPRGATRIEPPTSGVEPVSTSHKMRSTVINSCKKQLNEWCDELLAKGTAEIYDVCSIAFVHEALFGDGNSSTTEDPTALRAKGSESTPLHAMIEHARDSSGVIVAPGGVALTRATKDQVADMANWLTSRIFSDAWQLVPDKEEREARGESMHTLHAELMYAQTTLSKTLLSAPNFYHVNLHENSEGAKQLVRELVRRNHVFASKSPEL